MKCRNTLILLILFATILTSMPEMVKATPENIYDYYPYAYVYMNTGTLNLREEPDATSSVIEELEIGDVVEQQRIKDGWVEVTTKSGNVGYVDRKYLQIPVLKDFREYELIAASVITAKSSSENRNFNIARAAKKLDGLVLEPDEEFNWFKMVGNASKENGYKEAPILVNKKSVKGYGGGVCQVSTALYNCIYDLDIKPTEHHHHSIKSSYVESGMDATVSYPKTNFVFSNTLDYPIMFETYAEYGQVVVLAYKVLE